MDLKQRIQNIVNKENIAPNITPRDSSMAIPPITPREITRAINAKRPNIPPLEIPEHSGASVGPLTTDSRRTVSNAIDLKSEIALLS